MFVQWCNVGGRVCNKKTLRVNKQCFLKGGVILETLSINLQTLEETTRKREWIWWMMWCRLVQCYISRLRVSPSSAIVAKQKLYQYNHNTCPIFIKCPPKYSDFCCTKKLLNSWIWSFYVNLLEHKCLKVFLVILLRQLGQETNWALGVELQIYSQ